MPFALHGIAVSPGFAVGRAHRVARASLEVSRQRIAADQIDAEVQRLQTAQQQVAAELERLRRELPTDAPEEMAAFLEIHGLILNDPLLTSAPAALIRERCYNAEWALSTQLDELSRQFDLVEDEYLRERKADIEQVVERVLKMLAHGPDGAPATPPLPDLAEAGLIVVAHDIAPADMLGFRGHRFGGFVTDAGGKTSHTAIVARSLDIPAVVGVQQASRLIRDGDWIVVDGDAGVVIVDPTPQVLDEYLSRQRQTRLAKQQLGTLRDTPSLTRDGVAVKLLANIELPSDAPQAVAVGAVGVGLFRSEFLFMGHHELPDEARQFTAYRDAVEGLGGLPVTIRTLDIGADKPLDGETLDADNASALGLRAIRWSLTEPAVFRTQLRAILRASAFGPVKILIPMLAHAQQIDQVFAQIALAKIELDAAGHHYDPHVPVGAMIEIPAAVLALPLFLKRMDFLSLGTNDLIQYTLAIDRADSRVAELYDPLHPAVLQLIAQTIRGANAAGMPVSVCGEMAGDPAFTALLLGMGLTEFSLQPSQLLAVKQKIVAADTAQLRPAVDAVLAACEPDEQAAALAALAAL